MEITFSEPIYLWMILILPLLIVIHFYALKYVKNRAFKFANFEALKRVTGGMILSRNINLLVLRLIVLLFLILSLAGTTIWYEGESNVFDYVLAIDSSGSMLADDLKPNRIEAAKEAATSFIENLKSKSEIGLVSFSGVGLVELPLTDNKNKMKEAIRSIEISSLHGTAVGDALTTSANLLLQSEKSKMIILLTDGRENIASKEEVNKIIEYLSQKQIIVNTVGLGTEEGGTIPGLSSISTVDSSMLSLIANLTGGAYIQSETENEMVNALNSFGSESTNAKIPIHSRVYFILFALILLFVEWVLVNTKYRTIP